MFLQGGLLHRAESAHTLSCGSVSKFFGIIFVAPLQFFPNGTELSLNSVNSANSENLLNHGINSVKNLEKKPISSRIFQTNK